MACGGTGPQGPFLVGIEDTGPQKVIPGRQRYKTNFILEFLFVCVFVFKYYNTGAGGGGGGKGANLKYQP